MSQSSAMWKMLEVLWGWSHNDTAPPVSRCVDAAHTRPWSPEFMICSYWGIHTFIRREVFHLLVWCSSSLNNRRSEPVWFLSMERWCVRRRSCGVINHHLSQSCAALSDLLMEFNHQRLFSRCVCKSETCEIQMHTKTTVTRDIFHKSSWLSFYIFKTECSKDMSTGS